MVGMVQILTYLLCVYLVFKGFEILQIALASTRTDRTLLLAIGVIAIGVSVVVAQLFVKMIDAQAAAVGNAGH
jgi:hypothetical protein